MFRLLVVDDDCVDREMAIEALSSLADEVSIEEATDGRSALSLLGSATYDCLILDYQLPDFNGLQILEKSAEVLECSLPPVVMLTGQGNENIAAKAIKQGVFEYLPKDGYSPDMLSRAVRHAIRHADLQREIDEANEKIKRMALFDPLTGLGNRNLFFDQFDQFIAIAARRDEPLALFVMDLDRFKAVNDSLGHLAGDRVLEVIGSRLKAVCRSADIFFRLGGDEFAALLVTGATSEGVKVVANKIIDTVTRPIDLGMETRHVGISIGIAFYPEHGCDRDCLIQKADSAMYVVKRNGGGFSFATAE